MDRLWLSPQLSLIAEAEQELDRRRAVRMPLHDLHALVDRLIVDWYRHEALMNSCLRRISELEVERALAAAPDTQGHNEPDADHWRWAQELRQQLGVHVG